MRKKSKSKKTNISADFKIIIGFGIGLLVFSPIWWFIDPSTKFLSLIHTIATYGLGFSGAGFVLSVVNFLLFKKSKMKGVQV